MHASRSLSLLVLITTSLLSADEVRDESPTIHKIELLGGRVIRNDKLPDRPVIWVDLENSKRFTNGHVHLLKSFEQLTKLNLRNTRITDEGAAELGKLTNLTVLSLAETAITDEGLKEIGKLKSLTSLNVRNIPITDTGLKELKNLKNLNTLVLGHTAITESGETELVKSLPDLRILRTSRIAIQGIERLGKQRVQPMDLIKDR